MFDKIAVSVVIPTYNGELYIAETVESLLSQSVKPDEIIIVDDCSSDNTYEIIKNLVQNDGEFLKITRLSSNYGPSHCRNYGMKMATSDWVLFMDHDDIADTLLIEKEIYQLLKMRRNDNENWVLVHPAYKEINIDGDDLGKVHRWQQLQPEEVLGFEFFRNYIITTSGVLLNKKFALEAGGFDIRLRYSQDWDLWLKMAQYGGFVYVDEPLISVRRHPRNTSANINNFLNDEKRILGKYDQKFIEEAVNNRRLPYFKNKADYASILIRLEQWENVFEITNELVQSNPDFDAGYFLQGLYWIKKSKLNNALDAFSKAIEINPGNIASMNNYAGVLLAHGKLEEAETILRKLISVMPNYLDANHNLKLAGTKEKVVLSDIKFTWRELRQELITYSI